MSETSIDKKQLFFFYGSISSTSVLFCISSHSHLVLKMVIIIIIIVFVILNTNNIHQCIVVMISPTPTTTITQSPHLIILYFYTAIAACVSLYVSLSLSLYVCLRNCFSSMCPGTSVTGWHFCIAFYYSYENPIPRLPEERIARGAGRPFFYVSARGCTKCMCTVNPPTLPLPVVPPTPPPPKNIPRVGYF